MAKENPFEVADTSKRRIRYRTTKKITHMYEAIAVDFEEKAKNLDNSLYSDQIKKQYLNDMVKELNKSIDRLHPQLKREIEEASRVSAETVVNAQNTILLKAGLELKGAYGYVPNKVVKNLVGGSLYKGDWSLSQALWKSGNKTKSDVQEVVARGIAANKPIKDIADDLTMYLRPGAFKPWDWSKVYPGTSEKVEYNSQRLARTMVQHAFQQSMKESMKYNPWCNGIRWHSAFAHGRTCQQCMDRDGELYALKNLPLDHPNGLCYFEPDLESMDKIADDLADWALGKPNAGIDLYVAHAYY